MPTDFFFFFLNNKFSINLLGETKPVQKNAYKKIKRAVKSEENCGNNWKSKKSAIKFSLKRIEGRSQKFSNKSHSVPIFLG